MYDLYFLRRFIEEMVLAQTAADERERAVHLQACRYYGDLLHMNDGEEPGEGALRRNPVPADSHSPENVR